VVPKQVANSRDWRLFQELAVQADVVISSGRYLRDYASGHAQEILRVYDDPQFADLAQWRVQHGLSPQPDIAVISASLDFPIPEALLADGRRVVIFTTEQADPRRVRELEAHAGQVVTAGETAVSGDRLVQAMAGLGYRAIYSASGPKVLHLLLKAGVLDRLYLTLANRLLGGDPFSSIVEGPLLAPAVGMRLRNAYYDAAGLEGLGQLFLCYDRSG
jgi:riboflavin biosynthesis pyrimidine reductase